MACGRSCLVHLSAIYTLLIWSVCTCEPEQHPALYSDYRVFIVFSSVFSSVSLSWWVARMLLPDDHHRPYLHAAMLELLFEPSELLAQRHQEALEHSWYDAGWWRNHSGGGGGCCCGGGGWSVCDQLYTCCSENRKTCLNPFYSQPPRR